MLTRNSWKHAWKFAISIPIGILGGAACGGLILSFGYLIGRSGDNPSEPFGYWSPDVMYLGMLYGGLFGAFVVPIAYLVVLRKIGFKRPLIPALVGTLAGGFLGALAIPPLAVLTGILGFSLGVAYAARRKPYRETEHTTR